MIQRTLIALAAFAFISANAQEKPAASPAKPGPPASVPTFAEASFGPHPHQLIDICLPKKGDAPFPVLLWFGGIWKAAKHPVNLGCFASQGIAVGGGSQGAQPALFVGTSREHVST